MAGNKIASLFAELGFVVNRAGLKQFQSELKATANQINSQQGIVGATGKAQKTTNKFFADMQKNYSKMRPNLGQMKKDLFEVRKAIAGGLGRDEMRQAVELQERISRDIGKEYEKLAKQKARTEKQASDAVSRNIKQRQAMYQREQKGIERAERSKQAAMERTRNKLIQVTRRYSAHDAKLMQIRDSVRAVNKARRDGLITLERAQQEVRQLTNEYRRLQAAQNAARAAGPRIGSAGGIYAGGKDPRQVGNHRFISALHSDIGLGAMFGGFAIAQSSRAYQETIGLQQSLIAAMGDVEKGAEEFEWLIETTNRLGISLTAASEGYKTFAAATRGTDLAGDETRRIFESVSSYAKTLNLSADDTKGVFRALTQMVSKGRVQAEELRGQFGERLPGGFQAAARAMGMTTAELSKATENGEIVAEDLLPKLSVELLKMANSGGQLEAAMNNTNSAINRFGNNVLLANYKFQEAGMDRGIRNLMNTMSDFVMRSDYLWKFLGQLGETLADSFRAVFELLGTIGDKFESFEELANSLGLEMDQLAGIFAMFFKWGRRILFIFWLLPAAISGVSKLLDGENLSWAEWGLTIAGVAVALGGVYGWLKKLRGLQKPTFLPGSSDKGQSQGTPRVSQSAVKSANAINDWSQARPQSGLMERLRGVWQSNTFRESLRAARNGVSTSLMRRGLPVIGIGEGSEFTEQDYMRMVNKRPFWDLQGRLQDAQNEQNRQMIVNGDIRFEIEGKDGPQIADEVIRTINENFIRPASMSDPISEK